MAGVPRRYASRSCCAASGCSGTCRRALDARCARPRSPDRGTSSSAVWASEPWEKHPGICTRCIILLRDQEVSGAEVEISFLFADVRRSSDLARRVGTMEFTHLMQRFYATANTVLLANDAILDKFVGDEVVGFFLPMLTGPNHAGAAVRAATELLRSDRARRTGGPLAAAGRRRAHRHGVRGDGVQRIDQRVHRVRRPDQRRRAPGRAGRPRRDPRDRRRDGAGRAGHGWARGVATSP